ncbi:MAG: hypothetical protein CL927_05670 [Deltaproteobacteria bacterium]|nr:hypothetical protein [Deltaproteobacteria bacterium]HCH62939.1 hypothetical protein [Deltaproteobacteria bacterium]
MNHRWIALLAALGCAGSDTKRDTASEAGPQVTLEGQITNLLTAAGERNVEICVEGTGDCAISDANGSYRVLADAEAEVQLVVTLDAHRALLVPVQTGSDDAPLRPLSLLPEALVDAQAGAVGATGDPALGQVVFSVSNGIAGDGINIADVVATMEPESGVGAFYLGSSGLPDTALEATSSNGGGGWLDVNPGDAALRFGNLPAGCVPLYGWAGPDPLRFSVRASHATVLRIECAEAQATGR